MLSRISSSSLSLLTSSSSRILRCAAASPFASALRISLANRTFATSSNSAGNPAAQAASAANSANSAHSAAAVRAATPSFPTAARPTARVKRVVVPIKSVPVKNIVPSAAQPAATAATAAAAAPAAAAPLLVNPNIKLTQLDFRARSLKKLGDITNLIKQLRQPKPAAALAAAIPVEAKFPHNVLNPIYQRKVLNTSWFFFATTLSLFLAHYGYKHRERIPVSDRLRINWIPKILEDSFIAGVDAFWLSESQETRYPTDDPLHALVEEVGHSITKENGFKRMIYHVCESKEANAFVTPGGHVFVLTGMLKVLETKDDLAIVLGHEMSHKIAKHNIDDIVINLFINLFRLLLDYESNILKRFSEIALTLPYSRKHETEADYMGLIFAARAGYDPNRAALLWTRMAQLQSQQQAQDENNPEETQGTDSFESYLSTHPSDSERIANFHPEGPWMKKAVAEYESYNQRLAEKQRPIAEPELQGVSRKGFFSFALPSFGYF